MPTLLADWIYRFKRVKKDMIGYLRILAIIEGVSLLVLLFIAMPLKYYFAAPQAVSVVGMTHGLLFLAFVGFCLWVSQQKKWSEGFFMLVIISSVIPFATFAMDRKLKTMS